MPRSCSARIAMICSSENLLLRIVCLRNDRLSIQMRDQTGLRSAATAITLLLPYCRARFDKPFPALKQPQPVKQGF
jgi:hypothetical protein